MRMFARLLCRIGALLSLAIGLGLGHGTPAQAQTRPGTEIVNVAQVEWQVGAGGRGPALQAEARFVVARPTSHGVLTAWELDRGLSPGPFREIMFAQGDYRVNPFFPLPEPVDTSAMTGTGQPIDRSAPLRVFKSDRIRLGVPVFFTLEDAGLNFDPSQVETVVVTLQDATTGDRETLRFYETGPNTGEFSAWINTTSGAAVPSNGVMATRALSLISAQYNDATNVLNNLAVDVDVGPIDPFGIVFDSATGAPVDGIEVVLLNADTGQLAKVYGDDMQADYPARVITGSRFADASGRVYQMQPGEFRFPFVAPGNYRFVLGASNTHAGPSTRSDAVLQGLAGAPFALKTGSRLETFAVVPGPPLEIDIPVDALDNVQLTRSASLDQAGLGDFVQFTVTATSAQARALSISDSLPPGYGYVPGSAQLNGQPIVPQLGADGRSLGFALPAIGAGQTSTITYAVQLLPPLDAGQVLTSISQLSAPGVRGLQAAHSLQVRDVLGLNRVAIVGQVAAVQPGSCTPQVQAQVQGPVQGPGGPDLSGIRVLLEDGQFAITDRDGRFSFRDIQSRLRVLQLDATTLPDGARAVACHPNTRTTGSAHTQFLDLQPGLMGRAEFYIELPKTLIGADAQPGGQGAPSPGTSPSPGPLERFDQAWLDGPGATHPIGFLAPLSGHMPRSEAIDVVILQPLGARSVLLVNGAPVPAIRSEPGLRAANGQRELLRFRAVRIAEGRNTLGLTITSADGRVLHSAEAQVLYGLRPTNVALLPEQSVLQSDGRIHPEIVLRLTDRAGVPIRPGTQISIDIKAPFGFAPPPGTRDSAAASSRAGRPRISATVAPDGLVRLRLAPTLEGGRAQLSIPLSGRDFALDVPIAVPNRPWVLVGLAHGTLADATVRQHLRRTGDVGQALSGRVALFAEGVIKGKWLLSLRYDSAQDRDGAFYGIDPEADYLVYGDRSVQGSAAQSRYPLYLRLRHDQAEFLLGDFTLDLTQGGFDINQQLTGLRALFENERWRVLAFGAETENPQLQDRIALNGTVGPYALAQGGVVAASERVRLVTISRFDASQELASEGLQAGRDYVIDSGAGQIYLRRPIAAFTPEFHRRVLVVDYQVQGSGRRSAMVGGRAEFQATPGLRIGATALRASGVEGRDLQVDMQGVDLDYQLARAWRLQASSVLSTRRFGGGAGRDQGHRHELRASYDSAATSLQAYWRQQIGQVGLSARIQAMDSTTLGVNLRHRLWADPKAADKTLALEAAYLSETDDANGQHRRDLQAVLTRAQGDRLRQSFGLRRLDAANPTAASHDLRAVLQGQWQSDDGRLSQSLAIEHTVQGGDALAGTQLSLGADYQLSARVQMIALMQLHRLRTTQAEARQFSLGLQYSPDEGRSYRAGLAMVGGQGAGGGAASVFLGGDQTLKLGQGTSASFGMDAQRDLGAAAAALAQTSQLPIGTQFGNPVIGESFTTWRAGLRHEAALWGAGLDAEARDSTSSLAQNLRLRADGAPAENWALGAEMFLGRRAELGQSWQHEAQLRLSAAHRSGPRAPVSLLQADLRQSDTGGVQTTTAILSAYQSRYLAADAFLNLRYGMKYTRAHLQSGRADDVLSLLGAEYRHDLTETVDLGLHMAGLYAARSGRLAHSFGLSLGITPFPDGWLSFGYNITGFHDPDFAALGQTARGGFVQFRLKFDVDTVRRLFQ